MAKVANGAKSVGTLAAKDQYTNAIHYRVFLPTYDNFPYEQLPKALRGLQLDLSQVGYLLQHDPGKTEHLDGLNVA